MLSLFSIPKAFAGRTAIIQHNAIASWKRINADCEIVLFGDDPGVAEAAARYGVRYEPTIARNEFGTPLLGDIFERMNATAKFSILCFVNTDIILLDDFLTSVRNVAQSRENFLLVSSRYNCRIEHELPFGAGWATALRSRVRGDGRMYPAGGSDLFVYPRGLFGSVPNFAMGRGYWDTWLMREVRRKNVSLVDATALLTAVHQEHAYEHVPGVGPDAHDKMVYETPEGRRNLALMGGHRYLYTVFDATEVLTSDGKLLSTWRVPLVQRRIKAAVRRLLWRMTFAAC